MDTSLKFMKLFYKFLPTSIYYSRLHLHKWSVISVSGSFWVLDKMPCKPQISTQLFYKKFLLFLRSFIIHVPYNTFPYVSYYNQKSRIPGGGDVKTDVWARYCNCMKNPTEKELFCKISLSTQVIEIISHKYLHHLRYALFFQELIKRQVFSKPSRM